MLLREKDKLPLLNKFKAFFKKRTEVLYVYIFGSFAAGRVNALSDIDIAIYLDEKKIDEDKFPYGYKAHILSLLIQVASCNNLDLVILNQANLLLRHRVVVKETSLINIRNSHLRKSNQT